MSCPLPFWGPSASPIILETTDEVAALTALVAAALAWILALTISHSILRTFLEARGVEPWSRRDSALATPLVTLGAALVTGAVVYLTVATIVPCPVGIGHGTAIRVVSLGLIAAGGLMLRLGLLALRKLT